MIILKLFPSIDNLNEFKNNLLSETVPLDGSRYRSSGLYSKFTKHTITILDVENNPSLRGENFNIFFYGIIISWFSKKILLGCVGPSLIYTALTLLIVLIPFEYLEFRVVSLVVWFIVYLTSSKRIFRLKELILHA